MTFAITVIPAIGGHRWVHIEGRVDEDSAPDVRSVLATVLRRMPTRRLTLDLSHAEIFDEAARQALAEAAVLAADQGVESFTFDGAGSRPGIAAPGTAVPGSTAPGPATIAAA